ncbi:carbamoyl-phosphate synthase large subunit [Paludibaculum fermentans]|uniref:Carbamoyl phosphate synthase large chain n=1 Tax=Paludibaculum fermentans TaxID=1473598 RepID=A0A7S7SMC7_PALFE|nr:carbamoyl-phosphate synthase large subunit [Paludibaculum fermentans]QOY90309.1 carbamoyl-phosphate synthase large subunit [Paludibaculum fermentans]
MPRRNDIHRILIVGSGPIVIGQACEFDYSGTQACKALRADGYEVVLINSNPATIMTDPDLADRTYVEPLTVEYAEEVIRKERPDALLSTVGGQTGLNLAVDLAERGVLDKYGVELIGAKIDSIKKAEDRLLFKDAMRKIGLETPQSRLLRSVEDGLEFANKIGYPMILRPSFTLGGTGGGIAYNREDLLNILERGLDLSPVHEVLAEESVLGWKEYELEVMRDQADNAIIVCSIENFDPMGVHTGDSITIAPAQTLTDREYQMMRDGALACLREIGVDTGGSNVQFAIDPNSGRMVIVEMNPRVSRSSALASKATGFPIAKIAAKLAVGYRLDEIKNDITRKTPACFEPTIDYVVVKIPRWQFEKFPGAESVLTTQMKSVGEVMAIGRTFRQALNKGIRGLETGKSSSATVYDDDLIENRLITPNPDRLGYIRYAFEKGLTVEEVFEMTKIDPWFLKQIRDGILYEQELDGKALGDITALEFRRAKRDGLSDNRLARLTSADPLAVRARRKELGVKAVFNRVDTCAAEFESFTPYLYSSYESECEADPVDRKKVMILGSGPNRIGQGIEFDYCCCHASFALQEFGVESIMVNCNPETVSTDYDTSDRLYFEPLTLEEVLNICDTEKPDGVIVQFGGQTPLNLALPLKRAGVPIIGTDPENIDLAEDRKLFGKVLDDLGIPAPPYGTATNMDEACAVARRIGYPVLVRPSYVLGGRAMVIAYDEETVRRYMQEATLFSPDRPVLIDRFLEDAIEVDVDALSDTEDVLIGGIMEHIEEAGVHSGDSSCVLPPQTIPESELATIRGYTEKLARALKVIGLMNVQYAIKDGQVFVLEVNPRASRTAPYVSKATGIRLPKIAVGLMLGKKLKELTHLTGGQTTGVLPVKQVCVKSPVFPFNKFPGVDPALGPEMRSTGEVMGVGENFGEAFGKAQLSAGVPLPSKGCIFFSVSDRNKPEAVALATRFSELGFELAATRATAATFKAAGLKVKTVFKVNEGRPNAVDLMKAGSLSLVIYTTTGAHSFEDERAIRRTAVTWRVPCITTISGAKAAVQAIESRLRDPLRVWSLQEIHN